MSKFSINKKKQKSSTPKTSTDPHPGDYDLGSLKSRVAARHWPSAWRRTRSLFRLSMSLPMGPEQMGRYFATQGFVYHLKNLRDC